MVVDLSTAPINHMNVVQGKRGDRGWLFVLIIITIYSSGFYFFSFMTADTDLWGHLKFGEDLWISKTIPASDPYSYTAHGNLWINHEWLAELVMYWVYRIFGSPGLLMGKLLTGFSVIFLLSRICFQRPHHLFIYLIVQILGIFVLSPGFMIRPQLFTFLFSAVFLYVFHLFLERRINALWCLPVVMILWVNSHGGFLIGVGLFPVVFFSEAISRFLNKTGERRLAILGFWLIATELSTLINPYGFGLWSFLIESLSVPRLIGEWHPVAFLDISFFRFKILGVLFLCSFFINWKKKRLWEVGIIAIALFYGFKHQRHTAIFAIFCVPYLVERYSLLIQKTHLEEKIASRSSRVLLAAFLIFLSGYQVTITGLKYVESGFHIIVDPTRYPIYAVHFLKKNGINGNIVLPFEWGEYVIWKMYPGSKVSIDGRYRTVYPEEVLNDHIAAIADEKNWKLLLSKYPSDILLARRSSFFLNMISNQNDWIYVYSDRTSIIFLKNNDSNREVLIKLRNKELVYPRNTLSICFP
jgi:hypothetical protein